MHEKPQLEFIAYLVKNAQNWQVAYTVNPNTMNSAFLFKFSMFSGDSKLKLEEKLRIKVYLNYRW